MRYLLDTTVLIDFSKGHTPTVSKILTMLEKGDELGVCAITVAEFYAGVMRGAETKLDTFMDSLTYWYIDRQTAVSAGNFRRTFARHGKTVTIADALIAATALQEHAVLVTDNVKDFPMKITTVSLRGKTP